MSKCIECGCECEETPGYDVPLICDDCILALAEDAEAVLRIPDHECDFCETCGDCHTCHPL